MVNLRKGPLVARLADSPADRAAALDLRARCFRAGVPDGDPFDAQCHHVIVEDTRVAQVVCTFRLLPLTGSDIAQCYSAQFYALEALQDFEGPMVEMGRFCIDPDAAGEVDILRLAWGAMTAIVDATGVELLFGCSSFHGTEAEAYTDAFALLRERHLAPKRWLPRVKAPNVFRYAKALARAKPDLKRAMRAMPPLLKTYLMMGGWVSDHAVVDRDLGTLHVFTGVEVRAIPPARARLLRAVAG